MKNLATLLSVFFLVACGTKEISLDGGFLIEKSNQFHDKNKQWPEVDFKIHIQEPRVGNYKRYSVVSLNNKNNSFELKRNRDNHISTHIVNNKQVITLLDGKVETDSLLVKKYRLEPKRNRQYHRFYTSLLGLPMSLKNLAKEIGTAEKTVFNGNESYKIPIELKEPLFSKHWILYISKKEYKIIGLEMVFPEDATKGERLIFEGEFRVGDIILPRIRHWKELTNEYSGSDIILNTIN